MVLLLMLFLVATLQLLFSVFISFEQGNENNNWPTFGPPSECAVPPGQFFGDPAFPPTKCTDGCDVAR